jgi:phosphatidylglycerol:prolipoprotein diacylglycerol transferase
VSFPAGSPAYYQHLTAGLLSPTADRSLPVHPVQLYEMSASLALFGIMLMVDGWLRRWGESFLLFGFGYSVIRFAIEWFRADNQLLAYDLTFSQLASVVCACVCVLLWGMRLVLAKRRPDGYSRPRS